jgi:hypothetical protein
MPPPPSSPLGPRGALNLGALPLRSSHRYAVHPVENALRTSGALLGSPGAESHGGLDFQSAEGIYRAGAQGLPLPQIPQLPQSVVELTRLRFHDQAARRHRPVRRRGLTPRPPPRRARTVLEPSSNRPRRIRLALPSPIRRPARLSRRRPSIPPGSDSRASAPRLKPILAQFPAFVAHAQAIRRLRLWHPCVSQSASCFAGGREWRFSALSRKTLAHRH